MKDWKNTLLVLAIPLISLVIGLYTLGHYGINWDEPYHYRRGQAFLQYILTGHKNYDGIARYPALRGDSDNPDFRNAQKYFQDAQTKNIEPSPINTRSFYQDDSWNGEFFIDLENSYGHPPLNDLLAALFNKIFYQTLGFFGDLESYRLFIITIVSVTSFALAIFMWKEFGTIESVFTSIAFTTYPILLGEQHFNIKDPVETAFYTLTILTAYLGVKKNKLIWLLLSAIFFAFGLSTKFNIVFSIIPLSIWFVLHIFRNKKNIVRMLKSGLFYKISFAALVAPIITIGVLIACYPTIWKNPIDGMSQILSFYMEVGYPNTPIIGYSFMGFVNTFPVTWILFTTLPIVIILITVSVIFAKKITIKNEFVVLVFAWVLIAIGRNSLFGALSYGGVRIIMEFVPAISILAGVGAGYLIKNVFPKKYSLLVMSFVLIGFIPSVAKLVKIHPNENIYFNFLVGGLSGARGINLPYWGDSYGNAYFPAITWINQNAETNAKVTTPIGNTSNLPRFKLRSDIAVSPYYWSGLEHRGEYVVELTYNYNPMEWFALKYLNNAMTPVYEVGVDDVAIAKVWKNDLAHVKNEYKSTKRLSAILISNPIEKTLTVKIENPKKIMSVVLTQPTEDCGPLKTGYVTTSVDGKTWTRELEDIARDQTNRQEIKKINSTYKYYFMARTAKIIKFYTDSSNNCLLKATGAGIDVID